MQKKGEEVQVLVIWDNVTTECAFQKMLQKSQENNYDRVSFLTHFNQMFRFNTPENVRKPFWRF